MGKRLFDVAFSICVLLCALPLLLIVAIGIKFGSPGPVLYVASRAGRDGIAFPLYKFRTMQVGSDVDGAITGVDDPRIFPFGEFLRKTKVDELPQFLNVLMGHMSVVGPRPEDLKIVEKHYGALGMKTLTVRPGIASPGSLFNYTHADQFLGVNVDQDYIKRFLPIKLAIEKIYIDRANFWYDLEIISRTITTILKMAAGKTDFPYPKEYEMAKQQHLIS